MDLKGSKTEANLKKALAGEAQATIKYNFFESQAKKDGYEQIANIFHQISVNEKAHAKMWYKILNGDKISGTTENLKEAAGGENEEWDDMYEVMAKEAREEGFSRIAYLFDEVGKIEKEHEERYMQLLKNIEEEKVFSRQTQTVWQCRNCGHIVLGNEAPHECPVCVHPQSYFEIKAKNY